MGTLTFNIKTIVFRTMRTIITHSNAGDTTIFQILYCKLSLLVGMNRVNGFDEIAKSMQALCKSILKDVPSAIKKYFVTYYVSEFT